MRADQSTDGSASQTSVPQFPPDSPGSSVSTRLQEEYEELLKYAVVVPNYEPKSLPRQTTETKNSVTPKEKILQKAGSASEDNSVENMTSLDRLEEREKSHLPDFAQSPVQPQFQDSEDEYDVPPVRGKQNPESDRYQPRQTFVNRERKFSGGDGVFETVTVTTMDPDIGRMENLLDQWSLDLKRNVLAEFGQSKIRITERNRTELSRDRERFENERRSLIAEVDQMKELLHTYEQSMERKDQVISNMTSAMHKQRDRLEMMRRFCDWRMRHNDKMRENFASNLAHRHYRHALLKRVWQGWFSLIESKWRHRVEKACQAKAQEVCQRLKDDYEAKIAALNAALDSAREEIAHMHRQRDQYEETMKKAFMRGVCALNLEAMTIFHEQEQRSQVDSPPADGLNDNMDSQQPDKDFNGSKMLPQDICSLSQPESGPRIVTTLAGHHYTTTSAPSVARCSMSSRATATSSGRGRQISTRISAKGDNGQAAGLREGQTTLNPPMASVIVERHHPVVKQTIGHATASKYPKADSSGGIVYRHIAGQSGPVSITPNIQSIKVVE